MDENQDDKGRNLQRGTRQTPSVTVLVPIMASVIVAYLVIGIAMPVLPLHVHQGLG